MPDGLRARIAAALEPHTHNGHLVDAELGDVLGAVMVAWNPPVPMPPGTELVRVLDAMGMSQIQLARKIGLSTKHVNQICSGKAALSYETAIKLEDVTGVPASWWNAAEAAYRTTLLRGVMETWRGPKVVDAS